MSVEAATQNDWAQLLIGSIARSGVARAICSPGSRSTPLTWAALSCPSLETRLVVDERSAGFVALGEAKASGRPTLLISTSGSALGHYLPALLEASQLGIPMLLLTADRPAELQGCAAPQTLEQSGFYGRHVRASLELGPPEASEDAWRALARKARQAVGISLGIAHANGGRPGPVHLNAPLRKPLEPVEPAGSRAAPRVERLLASAHPCPSPEPRPIARVELERVASRLGALRGGFIAVGASGSGSPAEQQRLGASVEALAQASGLVVLVEAASGLRFALPRGGQGSYCDAIEGLFSLLAPGSEGPLGVLQLGRGLVSPKLAQWLRERRDCELVVLSDEGWPDPSHSAQDWLHGDVPQACGRLAELLLERPACTEAQRARRVFAEDCQRLVRRAWGEVEALLSADDPSRLSEPAAVRCVAQACADGASLVLGNSLPVREVDWFVPARSGELVVVTQRGANGIDGLISGALGHGIATGRPVTLLLGDLSFIHDLGGLALAAASSVPLRVVVLNNCGGRIFEHLPLAAAANGSEKLNQGWLLPHQWSLGHAAALFGCAHRVARREAELRGVLRQTAQARGTTVIEAVVDPSSSARWMKELRRRWSEGSRE